LFLLPVLLAIGLKNTSKAYSNIALVLALTAYANQPVYTTLFTIARTPQAILHNSFVKAA